ncbi:pyrimidodiazepine synthase [Galendromus occidentalis]|uniref:Pyrimidodiazepine synthase n=1 Tax=Galendromus occidentalis TaxID=34638 RepID=A0AAJ7L752_9ACAR|nr:pyrimidodiazepine synthase [Galendromus occidentalis]
MRTLSAVKLFQRISSEKSFCSLKMSIPLKAFAAGSIEPPRAEGALRIYSMRFCPFAMRPLLVLIAKEIPHEIVNINLSDKPEWYLKKYAPGKVPLLESDTVLLPESLIVSEYLEEAHPGRKLLPNDPYKKAQDKLLLDSFAYMPVFKSIFSQSEHVEGFEQFWKNAEIIENGLKTRGTKFLGGEQPGYLDLMIWPFFQIGVNAPKFRPELKLPRDSMPVLMEWTDSMLRTREVKELVDQDHLVEYMKARLEGKPNYDVGLES